jgi:hypothetical protein
MKTTKPEIILCCGSKKCPVLRHVTEDKYEITDDYGKTISITKGQLELIPQALKDFNDKCSTKS